MNTPVKTDPKFYVGDHCRLMCCLNEIYSGSIVEIQEVALQHRQYRYQVKATEYDARSAWADESELEWVIG